MVDEILPTWIEAGGSLDDYEERTLAEIAYISIIALEREKRSIQREASFVYWLATQIPAAIHKPSDLPKSVESAFPGLFASEVDSEEEQQRRFLEGVQRHNNRRR